MVEVLFLQDPRSVRHGRLYQWSECAFERLIHGYERALKLVLRFRFWTMLLNLALIAVSGWLIVTIKKGFFPAEDTGMIFGFTQASPDISFMGMDDSTAASRRSRAAGSGRDDGGFRDRRRCELRQQHGPHVHQSEADW